MFIRRSPKRRSPDGATYANFRLVQSVRINGRLRQKTLLNLGTGFDVPAQDWPLLCRIIEAIATSRSLPPACSEAPDLLDRARSLARQLLDCHGPLADDSPTDGIPNLLRVNPESIRSERPRSVGVEHVALWAFQQLGLPSLLHSLGLSRSRCACALGLLTARLVGIGSESAANHWLRTESALGELLDMPFEPLTDTEFYHALDALVRNRQALEQRLFQVSLSLFDLQPTLTLYDLTHTDFEGEAGSQPLAQRGHSDGPLPTLALALDGSGFVQRSQVLAGNVQESATLEAVLERLGAEPGSLVVMDRGIATESMLAWLDAQGYRYLAVSREVHLHFDQARPEGLRTASGEPVHVERVLSEDGREVRLYCYSQQREKQERAIKDQRAQRFEESLEKLDVGLLRPKARRKLASMQERVGRLKERSWGAAQHYDVTLETDETGEMVTAVKWQRRPVPQAMHPELYTLRSNDTTWDGEEMWLAYVGLTNVETVFRNLQAELDPGPEFHRRPERSEAHLLLNVLAYQTVQVIQRRLQQKGKHGSWATLRTVFSTQQRVTNTFQCANGQTLHVRKSTEPEEELQELYEALGVEELPGPTCQVLF